MSWSPKHGKSVLSHSGHLHYPVEKRHWKNLAFQSQLIISWGRIERKLEIQSLTKHGRER